MTKLNGNMEHSALEIRIFMTIISFELLKFLATKKNAQCKDSAEEVKIEWGGKSKAI